MNYFNEYCGSRLLSDKSESRWSITPHRFDLNPGASTEICLEVQCDSAKTIHEKILCHSIIGRSAKYLIKTTDVSIDFIKPIIELSTSELFYRIEKAPSDELSTQFNHFTMTNKVDLLLTCLLEVCSPFNFFHHYSFHLLLLPSMCVSYTLFFLLGNISPSYGNWITLRLGSRKLLNFVEIMNRSKLSLHLHFPNLQFGSNIIDFGCILNHTEMTEHLSMKNISPLPVKFRWSLLIGDRPNIIFKRQARLTERQLPINVQKLAHADITDGKNTENNLQDICKYTEETEHEISTNEQHNEFNQTLPIFEINKPTDEHIPDDNLNPNLSSPENSILHNLIEEDEDIVPLGIEELFDIVPLYGEINPGETISLSCTFYGHSNIDASVLALCEIDGGPEYKIEIKGSASEINFQLDQTDIDLGYNRLDKPMIYEFNILNTGKVHFEYTIHFHSNLSSNNDHIQQTTLSKLTQYGQFDIKPYYGQINGYQSQSIQITFIPFKPGYFEQELNVQIAYFLPKLIKLHGITDYAHLNLNLPRVCMIQLNNQQFNNDQLSISHYNDPTVYQFTMSKLLDHLYHEVIGLIDLWEKQQQQNIPIVCLCHTIFSDPSQRVLASVKSTNLDRIFMHDINCPIMKAIKQFLSNHYEVMNNFPPQILKLIPDLNLQLDAEREYICNLLNSIEGNGLNFENDVTETEERKRPCFISFDTKQISQLVNENFIQTELMIKILNGPSIPILLQANIVKPTLTSHINTVDFGEVQRGEARIITVQLHNPSPVSINWYRLAPELQTNKNTTDSIYPIRTHYKSCQNLLKEKQMRIFEIITNRGILEPNEKTNIQEDEILGFIDGYDEYGRLLLPPRKPGGVLPSEVIAYYEEQNKIANPKLSDELEETIPLENRVSSSSTSLKEMKKSSTTTSNTTPTNHTTSTSTSERNKSDNRNILSHLILNEIKHEDSKQSNLNIFNNGKQTLDVTPVSLAISRHLGMDLTHESYKSNKFGIVILVNGALESIRHDIVKGLANKYQAIVLNLNQIIIEALLTSTTDTAYQARQICLNAGLEIIQSKLYIKQKELQEYELEQYQLQQLQLNDLEIKLDSPVELSDDTQKDEGQVPHKTMGYRGTLNVPQKLNDAISTTTEYNTTFKSRRITYSIYNDIIKSFIDKSILKSINYEQLYTTILPDHIILQLINEHFNQYHHYINKGIIIDGIESDFTKSSIATIELLLKYFKNNYKYIYTISIKFNYDYYKQSINEQQNQLNESHNLINNQYYEKLLNLTDYDYEELSDHERQLIDNIQFKLRHDKRQIELEQKRIHEEQLREEQEAEAKRIEIEKNMKKKGKRQDEKTIRPITSNQISIKDNRALSGRMSSRPIKDVNNNNLGKLDTVDKSPLTVLEEMLVIIFFTLAEEEVGVCMTEEEHLLCQILKSFEGDFRSICELLSTWNRVTLQQQSSLLESHEDSPTSTIVNLPIAIKQEINLMLTDSDLIHVESIIGTKIKDNLLMTNSSGQQQHQQQQQQNKLSTELCQLLSYHLPELNEIINYLGIGSNGPPIPEPNNFSVIYYPMNKYTTNNYTTYLNRKQMKQSKIIKLNEEKLIQANLKYYEFLNSGYGDPMMMNNILPIRSLSQPTDSMGGRSIKKERKSPRQKHQTLDQGETTSRKPKVSIGGTNFGNGGARRTSVISIPSEQASLNDEISSVNHFRWIVPAKGQIRLRIRFRCDQLGQFDQIFNFELLNSRRNYQLYCRGICALPTISREPRLIYPKRKRTCSQGEIIHGAYLMSTSCFEFGPLLIEKSKDRIQENCYPENVTYFNLVNTSQMDSDIRLNFLNDPDEECYSVEPKELNLKPNQSTSIQICAFPKFNKRYDDALVCLIKDNPEPILLKLACDGVLPELELDKKVFNFEKVLLQRKEVRSIILKNRTLLPAQWKLSGIEALGDEFSVSQDAGIVEPQSESIVYAYFRAMKSVKPNQKRSLRLEVYDLENIAGLIQVETIQVIAEAYDVALDITFPKGSDGGIDFGLIKVGEEVRHTITLKNKGPYEIVTNFIFTKNDKFKTDFSSIFTMSPQRINLSPTDKLTQVNLTCLTQSELILKEEEILKCQIIEPNIKGTPQLIASIPIKLSVKAEFSKFTISPAHDINFGSLILNNHKTRQLIIENNGDYEFRYSIIPISKMLELLATREALMNKEYTGTVKHKMLDPTMLSSSQSRLQQGFFTLSPASGIVPPGNAQIITVDCLASSLGQCLEELTIEISDRDMKLYPHGIPYHLKAEGDLPSIETNDPSIIFEEHHVCKNLSVLDLPGLSDTISSGSIYGIEENRFVYRNVLVGSRVVARFRIANRSNVPAEVSFEVSAGGIISSNQPSGRSSSRSSQSTSCDSFEVIPDKALIEPHSSSYANVTFCPTSMQVSKLLDRTLFSSTKRSSNPPVLTFELYGEGNLPQISVLQPKLRNRAGQTLCVFKRIQVGKISSQILSLQNNGLLNSRLNIDLIDPEGVFSLKPQSNNGSLLFYNPPNNSTDCTSESNDNDEFTITKQSYLIGLLLKPKQQFNLLITYQPNKRNIKNYGQIQLMIINNEYEDTLIELIGESLNDEVCIDNIPQLDDEKYICIQNSLKRIISASKTTLDDIDYALQHNHLDFGDCGPNETITRTITISHCGKVKETEPTSFRFSWPTNNPILQFRPSEGHLHVNQSRRIEVTFKPSGSPITLKSQCIKCNLHRIVVPVPEDCTKVNNLQERNIPMNCNYGSSNEVICRKQKLIEIEPEPHYEELLNQPDPKPLELFISAVADFVQFRCDLNRIDFKETSIFEKRIYRFELFNQGLITLHFKWSIHMISSMPENESNKNMITNEYQSNNENHNEHWDKSLTPFKVYPIEDCILPGRSQFIEVTFSPLLLGEFEAQLISKIDNLAQQSSNTNRNRPILTAPIITITGKSENSILHFDLYDSDYISSGRRNLELPGPNGTPFGGSLDPFTRVIEFSTIGLGLKSTRYFSIVNTTREDFEFMIINEDSVNVKQPQSVKCLVEKGIILAGKKVNIGFEYISYQLGLIESFWRFVVDKYDYSVPLLVVGNTREPNILFDQSHINFNAVLIGHQVSKTVLLINQEASTSISSTTFNDISMNNEEQSSNILEFEFLKSSLHSAGKQDSIIVEPMSGHIPPGTKLPIQITFQANGERETNINLQCLIKHRQLPLTLNVKAQDLMNKSIHRIQHDPYLTKKLPKLNFGELYPGECITRKLILYNNGKFKFDFIYQFMLLEITPNTGSILPNEKITCTIKFQPLKQLKLLGINRLKLHNLIGICLIIRDGPVYGIKLLGSTKKQTIQFSETCINFGSQLIMQSGLKPSIRYLYISNIDTKQELSIECITQSSKIFSYYLKPTILSKRELATAPPPSLPLPPPPQQQQQQLPQQQQQQINESNSNLLCLPIYFYPYDNKLYKETIIFEINGSSQYSIDLIGKGCQLLMETKLYPLLIMNKTIKGITKVTQFNDDELDEFNQNDYRLPKFIEEVVCEISRVDDNTNNLIQLPKNQINTTTTTTDSQHRNKGEMISIHQENTNMFLPVFSIYGAVNTYDINFNTESINFGSIVRGSQLSKRLVLMNTGDYNAKFEWDKSTLTLDLTIEPMNGSIGPGLEVPFILTLKPNKLTRELRIDNVSCQIQGVGPKLITVSAACVPPTVIKEIQQFSTIVRQQDIKNLQIVNRSNANWQIKPVIDGEQWDGPKIIDIPPQQIGIYELTYKPLTMTLDGAKHKGTIFFPLPDGTGLLYNLCGISDAPKSMMRINREIECKKLHTEVVQIPNWLNASQRFRVLKEILRPDKLDPSTTIQGLDYLDVPADSSKEYKLSIFTYREGFTLIKVTFTNETTGEYQYFEVNFKSIRNKVLDVIRMQTPIRKSITHTLTLENPLSIPVNFQMSTNISEVQCPNQLQIPANCEGKVTLEYLPIKIGQYNGKFEANCNELGSFIYELNLQATQSGFESTLHFRTTIGQRHCQIVKFTNLSKNKNEFITNVDNSDYHCEKQITVAPGVEASLEVAYEPTTVGNSQATLTITSTQAGEYSFLLKGTALLPQPQGPIFIKAGETKHIIFRNVFSTPILYSFQVDNTIFNLPKQSEIIRPGKEFRIPVGLDSNITKSPVTGKLVVTAVRAQSSAQKGEGLQWVYYLRGITG
ncbi:hypothetical protein Smp_175450 [Schistosoma mansoni]|uniref:hypothetical protein n=1 Tax=Schistosoma mansoni TaxID=6183 RepID=UPI00022DD10D|nr:hypothetical protein Smp_175450 [Schistosoma mansoni]|eukprot:XP_018652309.1 hypothetical protein Smp_175450 [Schistosoma mansoni]